MVRLAAFLFALFVALPAFADQKANTPDWARVLLASDPDGVAVSKPSIAAPPGGVAARLVIAPTSGGVARIIRYRSGPDGVSLTVRRFTGHLRNGWVLWGGDSALTRPVDATGRKSVDDAVRQSSSNALMSGSAAALAPCQDGDLFWIELDDGQRRQGFERRCDTSGPAGSLLRKLSDLAGSRDEEELYQSGVQEILNADRALAKSARNEGVSAALVTSSADDAKVFLSRLPPLMGRSSIAQQYAQWDPKTLLQWEPAGADIAARGDMGYSWGAWTITRDGKPEAAGNYVNVWRRDGDGDWRLAANIGN